MRSRRFGKPSVAHRRDHSGEEPRATPARRTGIRYGALAGVPGTKKKKLIPCEFIVEPLKPNPGPDGFRLHSLSGGIPVARR